MLNPHSKEVHRQATVSQLQLKVFELSFQLLISFFMAAML